MIVRHQGGVHSIPFADDARLEAASLGVLAFLASREPGSEITAEDLAARFGCGRDRIFRAMRQLRSLGYLRLQRKWRRGPGGGRGWSTPDLIVFDRVPQ